MSGVTTSSLSLAWSLRNWLILDYEEANGQTVRPWAPFLFFTPSLMLGKVQRMLIAGAGVDWQKKWRGGKKTHASSPSTSGKTHEKTCPIETRLETRESICCLCLSRYVFCESLAGAGIWCPCPLLRLVNAKGPQRHLLIEEDKGHHIAKPRAKI